MKKNFIFFILAAVVCQLVTACYRMPDGDECSLVPVTNNPDVYRNSGGGEWTPGGSF